MVPCAEQDSETVYFNEAHETAKAAVAEALDKFEALLAALDKPEADKLQRSMGMKMQQLKVPWGEQLLSECGQHSVCLAAEFCECRLER